MVDTRATDQIDLPQPENYPTNNGTGGIKIESSTGGTVIDNTMYAYISHGPSGHGAWPAQGSTNGSLTMTQSRALRINTGAIDHGQEYQCRGFQRRKFHLQHE